MKLTASWKRGFAVAKAAKEHSNGARMGENMGSAMFAGSILVSIGFNKYEKSHPKSSRTPNQKFELSVHAEHSALIKRQYYLHKNFIMYVYREIYDRGLLVPAVSKPCSNCIILMKQAGVKRVRFYDENSQPKEMKL